MAWTGISNFVFNFDFIYLRVGGGGGVGVGGSGLSLGKIYFKLGVGGEGQDTSRHFEGGFLVHVCNTAHVRPQSKIGQKLKCELKEIELSNCHHSICRNKSSI